MQRGVTIVDSLFVDDDKTFLPKERKFVVQALKAHAYEEYLRQSNIEQLSPPLVALSSSLSQSADEPFVSQNFDQQAELSVEPSSQIPAVLEQPPAPSTSISSATTRIPLNRKKAPEPSDDILKANLAKAKIEGNLANMIVNIHNQCIKVSLLETEKRKVKKLLKSWNYNFEKENNRPATNAERKEFVGKLYEDYHKVRIALK